MDSLITLQELKNKLQALKARKACGPDGICTEMLKHGDPKLNEAILKIFNLTLNTGCFPAIWNQGLITPIFKSGDKFDPNNYRGICVSSNLGKVFCSIINDRILTFLKEHDVLSKRQIGFLPNHRTSDHIYTLHTLIKKHVHQTNKKKIFACFVDLKKAFDLIWHDGLFFKILQSGIGGKVYDIIKSMYSENKCSTRIGNKRTEFFTQGRGVRQGCCLSPTLFNIYINELALQLEQSAAPGLALHDKEIKFLLYADDLVLRSPTEQGLQQSLSCLEQFCQNCALTVNLEKNEVMVFQKKARLQGNRYHFTLGANTLGHTTSYTYLGLVISASGCFNMAMTALRDKARRAYYAIKKTISKFNPPIQIWLKIFDSIVQPILLNGIEIWGPCYTPKIKNGMKIK